MSLSKETIKHFRTLGHDLKPIVTVAQNGLSDGVLAELDRALNDHELVKLKIAINDREARKETLQAAAKSCQAEIVQEIGKVGLLFKKSTKAVLKTSAIR